MPSKVRSTHPPLQSRRRRLWVQALQEAEDKKTFLRRARQDGTPIELVQENPKQPGSMSWERYEQYKSARTLDEDQDVRDAAVAYLKALQDSTA